MSPAEGRLTCRTRRAALASLTSVVALAWCAPAVFAQAPNVPADLAQRLTPEQLAAYQQHLTSRAAFDRQLEMYWSMVEERRDHRRKKRTSGQAYAAADYIAQQPPKYAGPPVPPDVAKIIATLPAPPAVERPMATVADFLASAKAHYDFVPTPTTERDFKRRYAIESLRYGLSKVQVVRVYALETGGQGTIDMQSGIDPITKSGRPISSALGYAQLLHANSISELVKHGDQFIQRLNGLAGEPTMPAWYVLVLHKKAHALAAMLRVARSVPNEWREHTKLAQTPQGLGIHAINLDAEIGPWLQVLKLKGLLTTAASEAGKTQLTGAELELMNLAGPRTGLEMMEVVGRTMPTANFFSQAGYYRNTIVRERTGAELLAALDDRMNVHILKAGAVEFAAVFDEVMAGQPAAIAPERPARVAQDDAAADPIKALIEATINQH